MSWLPAVGRHVTYIRDIDEDTETFPARLTDYVKLRPAVITEIAADSNPVLRVGHHGETYGDSTTGVPPRTDVDDVSVYLPY